MTLPCLLQNGTIRISKLISKNHFIIIKTTTGSYKLLQVLVLRTPDGYFEIQDLSEVVDFTDETYKTYIFKHFVTTNGNGIISYIIIERNISQLNDLNIELKTEIKLLESYTRSILHSLTCNRMNPKLLTGKEIKSFLNQRINYGKWANYIVFYKGSEENQELDKFNKNKQPHFLATSRMPRIRVPTITTPLLNFHYYLGLSAEDRKVGILHDLSVMIAGSNKQRRKEIIQTIISQMSKNTSKSPNQRVVVLDFGLDIPVMPYDGPVRVFTERDLNLDPFLIYDKKDKNLFLTTLTTIFSQIMGLERNSLHLLEDLFVSYLQKNNNYSLNVFDTHVKDEIAQTRGEVNPIGGMGEFGNMASLDINDLLSMSGSERPDPNIRGLEIISRKMNYFMDIIPQKLPIEGILSKPGLVVIKLTRSVNKIQQLLILILNLILQKEIDKGRFTSPYLILLNVDTVFKEYQDSEYRIRQYFPSKEMISAILDESVKKIWDTNSYPSIKGFRDAFEDIIITNHKGDVNKLIDQKSRPIFDFLNAQPNFVYLRRGDHPQKPIFFRPHMKKVKEEILYPQKKDEFIVLLLVLQRKQLLPLPSLDLCSYLLDYDLSTTIKFVQSLKKGGWLRETDKKVINLTEKTHNFSYELENLFNYNTKLKSSDMIIFKNLILDLRTNDNNEIEARLLDSFKKYCVQTIGMYYQTLKRYPQDFLYYYLEYIHGRLEFKYWLLFLDVALSGILEQCTTITKEKEINQPPTSIHELKKTIHSETSIAETSDTIQDIPMTAEGFESPIQKNIAEGLIPGEALEIHNQINDLLNHHIGSTKLSFPESSIWITRIYLNQLQREQLDNMRDKIMDLVNQTETTQLSI
ncbi:MAG: hypothetical protein ACXAC7_07525 [Candidatus Hodarchaeales archaeon]|jgi:hypothetical protein